MMRDGKGAARMKMKRWLPVLVAGLLCGWGMSGCGGSGPGSGVAPTVPQATPGPPSPTATVPASTTPQPSPVLTRTRLPSEGEPHLTLLELTHDFGEIPPTGPVEHTFTFTNTGTADLVIQRVGAS